MSDVRLTQEQVDALVASFRSFARVVAEAVKALYDAVSRFAQRLWEALKPALLAAREFIRANHIPYRVALSVLQPTAAHYRPRVRMLLN